MAFFFSRRKVIHAGDVLLNGLDANGVVQLVDGVLKAQVEEFGLQVLELLVQKDPQ